MIQNEPQIFLEKIFKSKYFYGENYFLSEQEIKANDYILNHPELLSIVEKLKAVPRNSRQWAGGWFAWFFECNECKEYTYVPNWFCPDYNRIGYTRYLCNECNEKDIHPCNICKTPAQLHWLVYTKNNIEVTELVCPTCHEKIYNELKNEGLQKM